MLPRTCLGNCSNEIAELISVDSSLGICFDTNHLLIENPINFINKLGNRIVTLHISDYTTVKTQDGRTHNGSLLYTLRPLQPLEEAYFQKKIRKAEAKLKLKNALEKYENIRKNA